MTPRLRAAPIPQSLGWGVALALATALISGASIYLNAFAVKQLPDPAIYTTLKNGAAAMLLLVVMVLTVRPGSVLAIRPGTWGRLLLIGAIGGSVPFVLFFTGLAQASAPSAAFIHKTLFVWVALLAVPFLGERLGLAQLGALAALLAGQALILTPSGVTWGTGETLIALATLLWAVETILARRVLADVPSAVVGAARLGFGLVILAGYLLVTGKATVVGDLTAHQWGWVVLTGVTLAAYVGTWFAALQRAPASLVTAMLVLGAPVTAALQSFGTGVLPAPATLGGQVLVLIAGGALAIAAVRRSGLAPEAAAAPVAA